jgi:SAM-dependent methyltransferase
MCRQTVPGGPSATSVDRLIFERPLRRKTPIVIVAARCGAIAANLTSNRRERSTRTGTGHYAVVVLNPPGQYVDDRNLRARQRFWEHESPIFDIAGWVFNLAGLSPGMRVLDAGCGNGVYLRALADRAARAVGCDLSMGMLRAADHLARVNADVTVLPLRDGAFDVVLAIHTLYHVPDREAAIRELRRVLAPGGVCIAVTNGARELLSLRSLTERAVRQVTPDWRMRRATHAFTAENGAEQLGVAFRSVTGMHPASRPSVVIRDASLAGDFVASWASFYQDQTTRPWPEVVQQVRRDVQAIIDHEGAFITSGDLVAFVCR